MPEAKWVLRGRIVTNNTSPLYGNNDNIQYVIHEKGTQKILFENSCILQWVVKVSISTHLLNPLKIITSMTFFVGGFERWFNLTVVNISEDDADDYTCVGVNAGKIYVRVFSESKAPP